MSRKQIIAAFAAVWLTAFVVDLAHAQAPQYGVPYPQAIQLTGGQQPSLLPTHVQTMPAQMVAQQQATPAQQALQPAPGQAINVYPQTGAAMYPSPQPNVPYQVGGTMITNQAFAPHEMLYPHQYNALYGPYFYEVSGGWIVTPWGVRSYDIWKLRGTRVKVRYKPTYSLLSGFHPRSH